MSGEFEHKGNVFTTLLKYKQKYGNAELEFTDSIPLSSVKKILDVKKLSRSGKLVEEGDHYVLHDVVVVYEDDKKQVRIAVSIPWADANEIGVLKNIEIVITNKIEMLKKVIQEAIMKKEKDNFIVRLFYYYYYNVAHPPDGKIIYYTDVIKVNGYMLPDRGFFYANGNIYTDDLEVLRSAAKYIVELNGIKVSSLKELIQMFMKFKDKFYITEDTLANFKGNEVISLIETCAVPLYLDYLVIYTNDFKAEIGCGLILKKGVIVFSYEWVAASPDVWQALSTSIS